LPLRVPSFFEEHAVLVRHDLLLFQTIPVGLNPLPRDGRSAIEAPPNFFWSVAQTDDLLALQRQRDRLRFLQDVEPNGTQLAAGLGAFVAMTLLSAHAPRPLRFLFDRSVHLGPAIFDQRGMGVGIGGQFP
jgi:hypothetical protein